MATLIVHVLRAPAGIHPASAISLCVARDLATRRGATVTALAMGDAGDGDQDVAGQCSRYGADQLLFVGPDDLPHLMSRIAPRKVFVPNTPEGETFLRRLGIEEPATTTLHVSAPTTLDDIEDAKGVLVHAGTLPWHALDDVVEPDYGEHFADGSPVPWSAAGVGARKGNFFVLEGDPDCAPDVLPNLNVEAVSVSALPSLDGGALLCSRRGFDADADAIASRNRALQLCVIDPEVPPRALPTTAAADFVFAGPVEDVAEALKEPVWREAMG
ncbi:MAG: hypothetical protein ACPHRO_10680 [Nannocystaceae bacterium]